MASYSIVLYLLDLFIAWAFGAFAIYSAYDLCVHLPFAPLITVCLEVVSLIISWNLIYIPKLIKSKIHPRNVQKKLSRLSKTQLPTHLIGDNAVENNTPNNTRSNLSRQINISRHNSFSSISRYNSSANIVSSKCDDLSMNIWGSNVSYLIKTQIMDVESNQSLPFPISATDNPFIIRTSTGSRMEQGAPESILSSAYLFDSSKVHTKNVNNWTHFKQYYRSLVNKTRASGGKLSDKLSIWTGVNLWIKMSILSPLVNNSVWVIADIIITVIWCLIWQWAASYMKREPGDFSLLTWKFDDVPKFYWQLDAGFQCSAVFHYCIMLYYSNCKIKRIFSFHGLIELITTPCLSFILSIIYPTSTGQNENEHYRWLLMVGPIRCLRLLRAESLIYKNFYWLSEVKVIIVGVITDFLCLLFTFTGLLFLLESPRHSNLFKRPFDFFYFGVVTIGTVGYGDFAPITTAGRLLVIFIIFTSFTLGSVQLKRLKDAMGSISTSIGVLPTAADRYIVYWGPLMPNQLLSICRSLEASYEDFINFIVVLTTLPMEDYKSVYLAINKNSNINICITGGSSNLATPSYVADILLYSTMIVVVNEISVLHDNLVDYDDSIITIGDQDAILRLTSILKYTNQLKIPVVLQISNDYYSPHLASMDFDNVICIIDLTNAFLAKSVICKGLFYLILSLFFIPHDICRARNYVEYCYNSMFAIDDDSDEQQQDSDITFSHLGPKVLSMLEGMQYQFYRMPFAACMKGMQFGDLVKMLYMYNGSVLVGVIQQDGTGFLCPWNYIVGQELEYQSESFCGVVIAHSIEEIIDMASIKQFPDDSAYPNIQNNQINTISRSKGLETVKETFQGSNETEVEVNDYNEAIRYFKNDDPFIIVCGWPSSLCNFLTHLSYNCFNVIILAPNKRNLPPQMLGRVAYVRGTGLSMEDLINAGLFECYSLIILNCNHLKCIQTSICNYNISKNERYSNLMSYDHQSIFIRNLVCQILEREKDKIDVGSKKLINMETCHIITEINQASSVEFFDVTFSASVAALTNLCDVQRAWDSSSEFILSLQVTTGTVFVREMLYGLLAHSRSICPYAIDPKYIYTLLGINWRHNKSNKQIFNMEQHIKHGMTNGSISLVKMPQNMIGKPFKTLFLYMLYNTHSICIGIYRTYSIESNLKFSNGIIIASPQDLTMQKRDEIYIINSQLQD